MERAAAAQPDATETLPSVDQLARALGDAAAQRAATDEVLQAIGSSAFELDPVFRTVVHHAVRLCDADAGMIYQLDGDVYRVAVVEGGSEPYRRYLRDHPVERGSGTLVGMVAVERRAIQIRDALHDPQYKWQRARDLGGFRTMLGVPMLAGDRVVGVIVLWRVEVEPFDDRSVELVTTFAAQGAIAIQNVQLFRALRERGEELTRSVAELRAIGEVMQAVSSSLELDDVLKTIVTRAAELSGAEGSSIFEYDAPSGEFLLRTCHGTGDALIREIRAARIGIDDTFLGAAARAGQARQLDDLDAHPPDAHLGALRRHGWRSLVAVPLRRGDEIVGALVARRRVPGGFDPRTVDLLETLASQSVVAIQNARVFRELGDKTRQLEIAGRHKSEFLASMSHELRTPLNAVIGFSDVLLDRVAGDLGERQEEYVRDIRDAGRHLLELINEILDLSKVEAGRMELELGPVALPALLEHGVAMVRERATRHGIALAQDVAPEIGVVLADELKLKQVVVNLLTNAVKFTPEGGSVTLTARRDGGEIQVSVRDTGIGIAEDERERIFEAFQRGGRSGRMSTEGTGLGLTLSRRIVELHGGRMWLQSEVGQGSTFGFAIPAREAERAVDAASGPPAEASVTPRAGGHVLVVEDDARSADLLRVYLEEEGYAVTVARDGVAGLDAARRLRPRAIVLDILLPRLDGWDLLARLKGDPATAAIPVVMASIVDERDRGFALGAADYVVKPVDRERLVQALARCGLAPTAGQTVLAIDDDPLALDLVELALAADGWRVLRATNGEEGIALARSERPAVILLDLLMPDLDGFEVVERLSADPALATAPIVVLTSKDMTFGDFDRLSGRIGALAHKGTLRPSDLAAVVARVAGRLEERA